MTQQCACPLIDVVLPVYNCEATIGDSVRSLLGQTISDLRVIVVDDGSTDNTPDILDEVAASDSRVVLVRKPNSGIADSVNLGLSLTTAPYVARQDADDISFPERFEVQLAAMEKDRDVVALSGSCLHIDEKGSLTGSHYEPCDPDLADYNSLPSTEPYLLQPFLITRRSALIGIGGYRHFFFAEDTDLYWRLRELGRLSNLRVPLGFMRLHAASVSNRSLQNGRIMAVYSQLAALSARRRAEGCDDIVFEREAYAAYLAAPDLRSMIEYAGVSLEERERAYLKAASAVKLLTLAAGRLYELDREDCRLIREVYADLTAKELGGKSIANWAYRSTLARFGRKGLLAELVQLFDLAVTIRAVAMRLADLIPRNTEFSMLVRQ